MKFLKEFLQELAWDEADGVDVVYRKITGTTRWSLCHECVFRHDGRFYKTTYRTALTEMQDEQPYEYDPDEIECPEVFPRNVTTVVWE